ncbi:MAG: peptidylprolyl isomerase [Planctomycetes bacterium]|nr:peptidylprolyl isomerase [Planctomycetota bacterium]
MRDWIAKIETNHGAIDIELFPQVAPNHVENFLKLARSGFYEGSQFHRIIPGFMMQGGIPKDPAKEIKTPLMAEFSSTKHVFGTVSMARTNNPNSATSQFFICFGGVPQLDGNYSVFGQVVGGEEVVKSVERVKSDHNPCKKCGRVVKTGGATPCCGAHHEDRPEQEVVIKSVTVVERKK